MKKSLALCIAFILSCNWLYAATLHVLAAYDTSSNLKYSIKNDREKMNRAFKAIAEDTALKLNLHEVKGSTLSKDGLISWLERTKVKKDDVLMFYYTGHGFRSQVRSDKWPSMHFTKKKERLSLSQVIHQIKKKHPRLAIVLCDACNNRQIQKSVYEVRTFSPHFSELQRQGLKKLFLHTKGLILSSACQPGERAWSSFRGSIFTHAFLASLQQEALETSPRWEQVFKRSKKLCKPVKQKPLVELHIS